jgi:hypothetical protein
VNYKNVNKLVGLVNIMIILWKCLGFIGGENHRPAALTNFITCLGFIGGENHRPAALTNFITC